MAANPPTSRPQRTIKHSVEFQGAGLHSGREVKVVVRPAEPGTGVTFVRTDLEERPEVQALCNYLKPRDRRSVLMSNGAEVHTIEHLLGSLWALQIDNATIEIDGDEVPGLDGSAQPFVAALRGAGVVDQRAERKCFRVSEPVFVREGDSTLVALPGNGGLSIEYHLDYSHIEGLNGWSKQSVTFSITPDCFADEIASARTFVFEHEVQQLREAGFGRGATSQNTLIVGSGGVRENSLRYEDELARHKVLDLVGDLATLGADLDAHIIATRSGHSLNLRLVQELLESMHAEENRGSVVRESGMEIREIFNLLPHRYPFLMIDRVIELEGYKHAVGIKNVSINEPFFQGHWPEQPIMPGVLQLEAMAQLAGVLLLRKLENTGKLAVLWSIDKVKLRGAVVPGDQLRIEVDTIRAKPSVSHVDARCKVAGKLVAEAQLKFTLVDA
ncbi:MAG: UDP-3-O-[3-hydroxymyristoyl] N-acetylglucosamine deacetylase [Planctomycetes bacterium]|nr:UDP-3-O-[3-hydroxymyristoyl] N-acetylglucosamine deacetylase [Planctomycetota bacterium]